MSPSYIGAVWMFGGTFAPVDFALCDGRLESIAENDAMFAVLGTTYGGDGQTTFGLPDLRGRVVVGQGQGPGLPNFPQGQVAGTETVTLTTSTMAAHTHLLSAGTNASSQAPGSNLYINQVSDNGAATNFFSSQAATATLIANTIAPTGNNIPFSIIQPVTAVTYIIALFGIFPTAN